MANGNPDGPRRLDTPGTQRQRPGPRRDTPGTARRLQPPSFFVDDDDAEQRGQSLGRALGQSLGRSGGQIAPGGNSATPPNAFLSSDGQNGDPLATAFLPEENEPTATPVGEPERMGFGPDPSPPRIEDMPDSLTPEEMDMYDDLARAEVLARNSGDLPDSLTPEEMDMFGFEDITEDDLAEIGAQKVQNKDESLTRSEHAAFRKKQAQRSELDKAGGLLANAWNMAKFVGGEAAAASTAIVDAVGLPNFATEEELREIRVDPDRRTNLSDLVVSAEEGVLRWQAQLGVTGQNTMDSVTGGVFEEVANVDKTAFNLRASIPGPAGLGFVGEAIATGISRGAARQFLPKELEIDEDTEIELEYRRILRGIERELTTLPQEGESIVGAIATGRALDRGESIESAVETGQRVTEQVIEPLANTLSYAPDFLLGFGTAKLAVGMKARALVPSTVSRAVVESAGRVAGQTGKLPWTLRQSQRIDNWARETITPKVETGIRKLGSGGPSLAAGVTALATGTGGLATLGAFAAPYVARGALQMAFAPIKWTGRAARNAAEPFARALKAKHEFGLAGPNNAGMWARVAADTNAPGWARTTAAVSNRLLTNPRMRQLISDASSGVKGAQVGAITEGLQEAFEESLQTGATAESIGGGFGAGSTVGAGFGGVAGGLSGPKDIDGLLMDIDALHFRNKMAERGDDTSYFDDLPREARRDIAAAQAAAIDSADVRLVNGTQFSAAVGRPGMKRMGEGVYRDSTGEVLVNTDVVDLDRIAGVVSHELGHTAYARLPDEKKDQWRDIAHQTYGEDRVEKFRQDYSRAVGFEIDSNWALDEMFAEHFFGVSGAGRKLLDRKRQLPGGFDVGRSIRQVKSSVLAMLGVEGGVETGTDDRGRTLFDFTPFRADPAMERFVHDSLRDLGGRHESPSLPEVDLEATLTEQEAAAIDTAANSTDGPGSVVRVARGKHIVLLGQKADGSFDFIDLDNLEQRLRDALPPDDTRSPRAQVAAALNQLKTGRRDSDPQLAAVVDDLAGRTRSEAQSEPPSELPPPLPTSAPPEEAADPFGGQVAQPEVQPSSEEAANPFQESIDRERETRRQRQELEEQRRRERRERFQRQQRAAGSQLGDAELTTLFETLDEPLEPLSAEQREVQRQREEEAQVRKEVEKPEISSIVENAPPSQLKGARPPGDQRYAPRHRTVEPSAIRSIAGRTLSEADAADGTSTTDESASPEAVAFKQLNAIKSAAPILSARNARKARLSIEGGRGGQEHKVLIEPGNEWVTKVWDSHFNSDIDTPFDYLKRIGLQNGLFGDNIQVLGIYDGTNIVTRQPFYDANDTTIQPSESEIRDYMADRGFQLVDSISSAFSNGNIIVSDARPANFIRRRDTGELQLIDALIMEEIRPARVEPDQFEDVVDDVDSTERFDDEDVSDLVGDRFAPSPEDTQDIRSAYSRLLPETMGTFVDISALSRESGVPLSGVHSFLLDEARAERAELSVGDWPSSSPDQRSGVLELGGRKFIMAKLDESAPSQEQAQAQASPPPQEVTPAPEASVGDSIRSAYSRLLPETMGTFVDISALARESGASLAEVHDFLRSEARAERAELSVGDWPSSSPDQRSGVLELGGRKFIMAKLNTGDRFAPFTEFPRAGDTVDGRAVKGEIRNQDSIEASLTDFEVLPGIREVRIDQFSGAGSSSFVNVRDLQQVDRLAQEIQESGEIAPLIVVDDGHPDGPYILEGAHRFEALEKIGAESFPALVVRDLEGTNSTDRFAPLPPEVEFEFTRDEESGYDDTILTSNGVPVEGRSTGFFVYDGQANISTGLDPGARQIAGRRFKVDPDQIEVHRVNSIVIPDDLKGQGLGQALYLAHFQNVDAADTKPTYFHNSQQSAEALAATLALERKGLLNFMPLSEGGRPTSGQTGGPYLSWLTDKGRNTDPKTLQKRGEQQTPEDTFSLEGKINDFLGEGHETLVSGSPHKAAAFVTIRDGGSFADVVIALASGQVPDSIRDARPDRFAPPQEPGRTPGVLQENRAQARGLRGRGRVAGSEGRVSEPYRPYPQSNEQPLDNLASTVRVDGRRVEFGPLPAAREAARSYMQQAGLPYNPPTDYVRVDQERAARIADEFERMEHAPEDPEVQAAYRAMIDETLAQYDAIKETGLVVEPIPFGAPDPYGNPRNAILDVVENNHMWFFPTQAGFGGPASTDVDISGNPLLEPTGETINGHEMVANDVFRVVHDYFGHIKEGLGFRADGEENAWRSHSSMYSDLARRAMTTETRGQNSWVNFGPFGEQNQTANGSDTEYAPQKIGLLPEWVVNEGRGAPGDRFAPITSEQNFVNWFGDSKVTTPDGRPKIVFHGHNRQRPIDAFELPEGSEPAIFFTDSTADAREFARLKTFQGDERTGITRTFLRIENPARIDAEGDIYTPEAMEGWIADAKANGNDGLIIANLQNFEGSEPSTTFAVFSPFQVKSATRNTGAFDPTNPDIRFAPSQNRGIVEDATPTPTSPALGASLSAEPEAADTGRSTDLGRAGEGSTRPGGRLAPSGFRSQRGPGSEAYNRTRPRTGVNDRVRAAQERIANQIWDRVGPETDHFRRGVTGTPDLTPVVHYSTAENPRTLDPARSGTGTPGAEERRRVTNPILYPGRVYFGDETYSQQPEGFVTSRARSRVDAELDMDQVWTYAKHPELLDIAKETAQAEEGGLGNAATYLEAAVEAAGYQGLYFPDHNAGYLLHEVSVPESKPIVDPFVPHGTLAPTSENLTR